MAEIVGYNTITTVDGDTFDALALQFYTDEQKASVIIKANPDYCTTLIFDAGVVLKIPILDEVELPETLPPWRRGE